MDNHMDDCFAFFGVLFIRKSLFEVFCVLQTQFQNAALKARL